MINFSGSLTVSFFHPTSGYGVVIDILLSSQDGNSLQNRSLNMMATALGRAYVWVQGEKHFNMAQFCLPKDKPLIHSSNLNHPSTTHSDTTWLLGVVILQDLNDLIVSLIEVPAIV